MHCLPTAIFQAGLHGIAARQLWAEKVGYVNKEGRLFWRPCAFSPQRSGPSTVQSYLFSHTPKRFCQVLPYCLQLAVLFLSVASANAGDAPTFAGSYESASATIHFNSGEDALAKRVGEILDYAEHAVGSRYGQVPNKILAYIYSSDEAMVEGVRQTLEYQDDEAAAAVRVGVTEVKKGTFHVHARVAHWGDALWHVIVDEYIHGVTEARFGLAPAESATWIDEGLSSYLAHQVVKERIPEFEAWFFEWTRKTAFKELVLSRLPKLRKISNRPPWVANINSSRNSWKSQYSAADVSIFYIVDNYGLEAVEAILSKVANGVHYTEALRNTLGISLEQLEADVHRSLFMTGLFHLYPGYTAALVLFLFGTVALSKRVLHR